MIKISFNEDNWTHDVLSHDNKVLASVQNEEEAEKLKSFYQSQEEKISPENDNLFWSWRHQDELGGE